MEREGSSSMRPAHLLLSPAPFPGISLHHRGAQTRFHSVLLPFLLLPERGDVSDLASQPDSAQLCRSNTPTN